ncbi:MAG: rod shape-determining protein RodA [Candidatus Omnitrophica bacterium]|nr:rod shape-determining protein RodA [Candidatus Omnitrophota bacterium]
MRTSQRLRHVSWDWGVFICGGLLCAVSLVSLASAGATLNPALVWRQAMWISLGMAAGLAASWTPYPRWLDLSAFLYLAALGALALVEVAGTMKLGAVRWLTVFGVSVQPSELAKLATACILARVLGGQPSPLPWRSVLSSALLAGMPALLIFLQPDLGSSSILAAVWIGVVWVARMSRRHLATVAAAGCVALPIGWHLLKEYQRTRLLVFVNPHADPLGAGYTIIQSKIAIGSGQLWGRGWLSGTQNQLNFLPERHADFLYSVIGEEWGFLGAALVVGLFGCLLWRAIRIALENPEPQGRLLATGLTAWLGYQAIVNMGMAMGLVPVVGVPLPLVSYGGSAMVTTWIALGLLQSVHRFGTRF